MFGKTNLKDNIRKYWIVCLPLCLALKGHFEKFLLPKLWTKRKPTGQELGRVFNPSGLYYKHVTIVNDNSSVISKGSFKLSDDARVVIYDCHRFIIQVTDVSSVQFNSQVKQPSLKLKTEPKQLSGYLTI